MLKFFNRKFSQSTVSSPEELAATRLILEEQLKNAAKVILAILLKESDINSIDEITPDKVLAEIGVDNLDEVEVLMTIEDELGFKRDSLVDDGLGERFITVERLMSFVISKLESWLKDDAEQKSGLVIEEIEIV